MKLIEMDVDTLLEQTRSKEANPGGGAVLILTASLALNLMLMMDKDDFGEKNEQAVVSRETIMGLADLYKDLMQADVDEFNKLMTALKSDEINDEHYIAASRPLLKLVEHNQEAMRILSFYLLYGKKATLSDGQIANDLLRQTALSALPTIKLNLDNTPISLDYNHIEKTIENLYQANNEIIEERKK